MAKKKPEPKPRRQRRDVAQIVADLEAKIAALRQREAEKKAKADPALRFAATALKAVDKGLAAAQDGPTKKALAQARSALAACLGSAGSKRVASGARGRAAAHGVGDLPHALLTFVRNNPGQRGEQIAAALETDSGTIRPVMKRLIDEGKVKTAGQKRGMTYSAV